MTPSTTLSMFILLLLYTVTTVTFSKDYRPPQGLTVSSRLCCEELGNCLPGSEGLANVVVKMNCTDNLGTRYTLCTNTTDSDGKFSLNCQRDYGVDMSGPAPFCVINIPFPLKKPSCPLLSSAGSWNELLSTILCSEGTVYVRKVGRARNCTATPFFVLPS